MQTDKKIENNGHNKKRPYVKPAIEEEEKLTYYSLACEFPPGQCDFISSTK